SPEQKGSYPYAQVVARFDAIAPMVYWLNRQPGPDVEGAIRDLRKLGKPIFPIGQAYDGAREGGRAGVPPRAELVAFMDVAARNGAQGVSFWVCSRRTRRRGPPSATTSPSGWRSCCRERVPACRLVVRFLSDEWLAEAAALTLAGGHDDVVCVVEQVVRDSDRDVRYHLRVFADGV